MGHIPYITTLCLNGTLPCVDFMDVIMGHIPYITTLCLNGTLPCVDFMDVIMGHIPYITTLCLNGTLPCVDFMDATMVIYPESVLTTLSDIPTREIPSRNRVLFRGHLYELKCETMTIICS